MNELKILLIGCGKMGSSLLEGIVKSDNFDGMVDVIEPVIQDSFKEDFTLLAGLNFIRNWFKANTLCVCKTV